MFKKIFIALLVALTLSSVVSASDYMGNPRSKKLHYSYCRTIKRPENYIQYDSYKQAIDDGYIQCRVCCPVEKKSKPTDTDMARQAAKEQQTTKAYDLDKWSAIYAANPLNPDRGLNSSYWETNSNDTMTTAEAMAQQEAKEQKLKEAKKREAMIDNLKDNFIYFIGMFFYWFISANILSWLERHNFTSLNEVYICYIIRDFGIFLIPIFAPFSIAYKIFLFGILAWQTHGYCGRPPIKMSAFQRQYGVYIDIIGGLCMLGGIILGIHNFIID